MKPQLNFLSHQFAVQNQQMKKKQITTDQKQFPNSQSFEKLAQLIMPNYNNIYRQSLLLKLHLFT